MQGIAEPGGICLSRSAYEQVKGKIDAQYADMGEQRLKNIADPLQVFPGQRRDRPLPRSAPPALPLPAGRPLCVLPFTNLSDDPEQRRTSRTASPNISPRRCPGFAGFFVIARNSAFVYKDKAVDVRTISPRSGRALCPGGQRTARLASVIRITGQLIDAGDGQAHLGGDTIVELHDISWSRTRSRKISLPRSSRTSTPRRAIVPPDSRLKRR